MPGEIIAVPECGLHVSFGALAVSWLTSGAGESWMESLTICEKSKSLDNFGR